MAKRVNPVEARRGVLLGSWPARGKKIPPEMDLFIQRAERELERSGRPGKVVYTRFENWGRTGGDTWQVFLLR